MERDYVHPLDNDGVLSVDLLTCLLLCCCVAWFDWSYRFWEVVVVESAFQSTTGRRRLKAAAHRRPKWCHLVPSSVNNVNGHVFQMLQRERPNEILPWYVQWADVSSCLFVCAPRYLACARLTSLDATATVFQSPKTWSLLYKSLLPLGALSPALTWFFMRASSCQVRVFLGRLFFLCFSPSIFPLFTLFPSPSDSSPFILTSTSDSDCCHIIITNVQYSGLTSIALSCFIFNFIFLFFIHLFKYPGVCVCHTKSGKSFPVT